MKRRDFKVKYIVTAWGTESKPLYFEFPVEEKSDAIALVKNLSLRYLDARLLSVDSDDDDITYDLTGKYV